MDEFICTVNLVGGIGCISVAFINSLLLSSGQAKAVGSAFLTPIGCVVFTLMGVVLLINFVREYRR